MSGMARGGATASFGKYNVLCRWAAGGMAEIYIARQSGAHGFDKLVALKLLRPELAGEGGFRDMFFAEARTGALLTHPNIVHTFDVGDVDGHVYMAMEFVNGESLSRVSRALTKDGARFPTALALSIIRDVAAALDYAHTLHDLNGEPLQLVHRDVSPSNVMLTHDGSIKLLDFGIAKVATEVGLTQAGAIKGKFSYLSPEQARSEKLDGRSDVFSLGVVAWQLLTSERAFKGDNEMAILNAIVNEDLAPPSAAGADANEELDALIVKAVQRDREQRYQTARELSEACAAYLTRHYPGYSAAAELREVMGTHFGKRATQLKKVIAAANTRAKELGDSVFDPQDAWSLPSLSPLSGSVSGGSGPLTGMASGPSRLTNGAVQYLRQSYGDEGSGPSHVSGLGQGYAYAPAYAYGAARRRGNLALLALVALILFGGGAAAVWLLSRAPTERAITITSAPEGAQVLVDGQVVGETPVEVHVAWDKPVNVVVKRRGYVNHHETIKAEADVSSVHATLAKADEVGTLVVQSEPPGATVVLDGSPLPEPTPSVINDLWVGEPHTVVITLNGYEPVARRVDFDSGASEELRVRLAATSHAYVAARCEPEGCDVFIDGAAVGKTPLESHAVAAGIPVSVQLVRNGEILVNERCTLEAGALKLFKHVAQPVAEKTRVAAPTAEAERPGVRDANAEAALRRRKQPPPAWRVESTPSAAVYDGNVKICAATPCTLTPPENGQSLTITLLAEGYSPAEKSLGSRGGRVSVELKRKRTDLLP